MLQLTRINPSTIKEIECSTQLTQQNLAKKTFEILKIKNCLSLEDAFDFITSHELHSHFHHAKCAFVIVAEIQGEVRQLDDDELGELSKLFKDKKVMIISFESEKSEIYFKQLHENNFKSVENSQLDESFNFGSLLHRLNSQSFGAFNGKLLDTTVDTQTCYDGKRLIDFAVESNKILSIRFLQLFNFDLKLLNQKNERPLEIAASHSTMDAFIALLKFKFEFWNDELCKCDYNLLHLRNSKGLTLLMLAAGSGNSGVVNLLVKFGVDKNYEVSLKKLKILLILNLNFFVGFSIILKIKLNFF